MSNHIALRPRIDGSTEKVSLKTRVPAELKRAMGLLALERDRPLQHEIHDALVAHVARVRRELAEQYVTPAE